MQIGWKFRTKWGVAAIIHNRGDFDVIFDGDNLGCYDSAAVALDELIGGHTNWPSCGKDPSEMGIPDDLSEWQPVFSGT